MRMGTRVTRAGLPPSTQGAPFLPGPTFAGPYHAAGDPASAPLTYGCFHNPPWTAYEQALSELEASWLNMVEIELGILQRQCLDRCISDEAILTREIIAYEDARNLAQATIVGRFTAIDAREKLYRLYPSSSK